MDARGEAEEGLEGRHRRAPAVEAEGELVEVGLEVIVADAVVGTVEPGPLRLPNTRWVCGKSLPARSSVP